jgi:hypothetical protein
MDAPAATVDPATHAVVSQRTDNVQLALYPLEQENMTADVVVGHKDPPIAGWFPMQNRATATVGFHKQQDAPAIFATFLYPYQGNATAPSFQAKALTTLGDNVWSRSFETPNEKAEVALAKDNKTQPLFISSDLAGTVRVEAAGWTIRQPAGATQIWQGGWGVQSYKDSHWAFTLNSPGSLVFGSAGNGLVVYNAGDAPITLTLTQPFAVTATAGPGIWTNITAQGGSPAAVAPTLFPPLLAHSLIPSYADYLKAQSTATAQSSSSVKIKATDFALPAPTRLAVKIGLDEQIITKWTQAGAELSAHAAIPQSGWYKLTLHYCSGGGSLVSLLINDTIPFEEAEDFPLDSTLGAPPSDGWSNVMSDWHELVFGADSKPGGLKIYLPAGNDKIALRQEGGSGANLAWLNLDPAKP